MNFIAIGKWIMVFFIYIFHILKRIKLSKNNNTNNSMLLTVFLFFYLKLFCKPYICSSPLVMQGHCKHFVEDTLLRWSQKLALETTSITHTNDICPFIVKGHIKRNYTIPILKHAVGSIVLQAWFVFQSRHIQVLNDQVQTLFTLRICDKTCPANLSYFKLHLQRRMDKFHPGLWHSQKHSAKKP